MIGSSKERLGGGGGGEKEREERSMKRRLERELITTYLTNCTSDTKSKNIQYDRRMTLNKAQRLYSLA